MCSDNLSLIWILSSFLTRALSVVLKAVGTLDIFLTSGTVLSSRNDAVTIVLESRENTCTPQSTITLFEGRLQSQSLRKVVADIFLFVVQVLGNVLIVYSTIPSNLRTK